MRKHWIDNLRWATVLLLLLYHVVYFYNNKGVIGGIGGFGDGPQYQDVIMYILYPWFMPLLFILAGISARYALEKHPAKEWFKARTRKLLVPSTIGLFVFGFIVGWFNSRMAPTDALARLPGPVKYLIWTVSGTGPLWFIQDLWLFSLLILLVRKIDAKNKFYDTCGRIGIVPLILMGVLFWLGHKTLIGWNDRSTIWLVVYTAFSSATSGGYWDKLELLQLAGLVLACLIILGLNFAATWYSSLLLGFNREDRITIVFCGSKKSLAVGAPMMMAIFGTLDNNLLLPLMVFHQVQLMACAHLARHWQQKGADTGGY